VPKSVKLHRTHPSLVVTLTASKTTEVTLKLLDSKGNKLASWTKHARAGKNTLTLLLSPIARAARHDKLEIGDTGSSLVKAFTIALTR
jgi:hypothetical protein